MYRNLTGTFLLFCILLAGCEKFQQNTQVTEEESLPEVTERLCHIARIGNMAEMSESIWETTSSRKPLAKPDLVLLNAVLYPAVGQEVDPDFLKIVESAAQEATSSEGLKKAGKKEEELNFAIEMVEEDQKTEKEMNDSKPSKNSKKAEEDEEEIVNISMEEVPETEESEEAEGADSSSKEEVLTEKEAEDSEVAQKTEDSEEATANSEVQTKDADASETAQTEENSPAGNSEAKTALQDVQKLEDEMNRQAEELLEILKNTPEEVREEIKNAHFQNVSYRLVKLPGSLVLGKVIPEYYIIRNMEYTGDSLTHDLQQLNLSRAYSDWISQQEKYLDIMAIDKVYHDYWAEVPEFWNSNPK